MFIINCKHEFADSFVSFSIFKYLIKYHFFSFLSSIFPLFFSRNYCPFPSKSIHPPSLPQTLFFFIYPHSFIHLILLSLTQFFSPPPSPLHTPTHTRTHIHTHTHVRTYSVRERLEALGEGACKLFDKLVHLDPARRYVLHTYLVLTFLPLL